MWSKVSKMAKYGIAWFLPYDSQDAAVAAQQTLQHSGIDSIVVKR